jgi:hypothetical protein
MNVARKAIEEADQIISSLVETIVELAQKSIQQRRKEAAWRYVRASRRAAYASTLVARRVWEWRARRWRAIAEANAAYPDICCALDSAMAGLPRFV